MLRFQYFLRDTKAGVNVALLAIPQGMAYALIAGLPLHFGLLASGIAAFVGGIVGGGRFITLGPTNATAVLLLGVFLQLQMVSNNGEVTQSALLVLPGILVCTGIWLVLAGLFRISFLILLNVFASCNDEVPRCMISSHFSLGITPSYKT